MESNSSNFSDFCDIAKRVLDMPGYSIFLITMITCASIAIIVNFFLFFSIWHVTIFHTNLRVLFAHVAVCGAWYSASCLAKSAMILSAYVAENPCKLITDPYKCRLQEISRSWPSQSIIYACISVTLERLYCTMRYKKPYEGRPWLAMVLIPCCYVVPLINFLKGKVSTQPVPICESSLSVTLESAKSSIALNTALIIMYMILVCVFHYWTAKQLHNMLANRALTHTLAARFQLDQNMQLTRIIRPTAILEFMCFIPNQIFLFLVLGGLPLVIEQKTLLIQCNYLWKVLFTVAYPSLCFARNAHLRGGLIKMMPYCLARIFCSCVDPKMGNKVAPVTVKGGRPTNAHFEILEKAWKK